MDNIRAYIEQTVLLLGQTSNYITYIRRYNLLAALNYPSQQSKEMLREEADLLQRHGRNLFGKNTWWLQLNQRNRSLKYLLKRARKNKSPFGIALQKHRGAVLEGCIRNSSWTKDMGNWGKKYSTETSDRPTAGRSSGFQGKNKHKGNLIQHVVSSYNSNRRSEECSSMGKKFVLCKKSPKLATSVKVKTFFGSMGDTYKRSRKLRKWKGVQDTFSKKSNRRESSPDVTHGPGISRSNTSWYREHVEEGSHTATRASGWGVFK